MKKESVPQTHFYHEISLLANFTEHLSLFVTFSSLFSSIQTLAVLPRALPISIPPDASVHVDFSEPLSIQLNNLSSYFIYGCKWEQLKTLNKLGYISVFLHRLCLNYQVNSIADSKKYLLNMETAWEWEKAKRQKKKSSDPQREREQNRQRHKVSRRNNFIKIRKKRVKSQYLPPLQTLSQIAYACTRTLSPPGLSNTQCIRKTH